MPRPVLAAVAEQQTVIESLRRVVAQQGLVIDYIARVAGITPQVEAIRRTADVNNPAQPIPDPGSQGAVETTEQAATPEAYDNAQAPGMTPGSTQHVPAEVTGTPMDPGTTLPTAPYNELQEVTAPISGTEAQRPLPETRTEVDVRVGDPMNPATAFPWTMSGGPVGGGVTASQDTPEQAQGRTMAAMHLARLRIQAGTASGDDLQVAASIEADESLSTEAIRAEIGTLDGVVKAASRRTQRPASAVPRAASGVRRTTPSLVSGSTPGLVAEASAVTEADAEDIFL